jgi:RHS repeat-associated protein
MRKLILRHQSIALAVTAAFLLSLPQAAYPSGLLQGHLGSTNSLVDDAGTEVTYTEYLPFGGIKLEQGSKSLNKKFTGKELDSSTGLYDYGARHYDSTIQRFITPDPIDPDLNDPQSLNRYSYTLNNPLKYIDPSGHQSVFIGGLGVIFVYVSYQILSSIFIGERSIQQSQTTFPSFTPSRIGFPIPGISSSLIPSSFRIPGFTSESPRSSILLAEGSGSQKGQGDAPPETAGTLGQQGTSGTSQESKQSSGSTGKKAPKAQDVQNENDLPAYKNWPSKLVQTGKGKVYTDPSNRGRTVREMDPVSHSGAEPAKRSAKGYIRYTDGFGGKSRVIPRR